MDKKGFFSAIIALITIVLLSTMVIVQQNVSKNTQEQYFQRTVFELKTGTQNMQYLLGKAMADAMTDCVEFDYEQPTTWCELPSNEDYATKIAEYFNGITGQATDFFGIQCDTINVPDTIAIDASNFSFNLTCRKVLPSGFKAEYTKTINLSKEISIEKRTVPGEPDRCVVQVKDLQSGTCDALVNTNTCS